MALESQNPARRGRFALIWALGASALLHGLALGLSEFALRSAPKQPGPPRTALTVQLEPLQPVAVAEPPTVIKNTLQAAPKAPRRETVPTPARAQGATARPAEPLPEGALSETLGRLSETLLYPPEALKRGIEGEVVLLLEVGEGGRILEASVASSSGHAILDQAAIRAVRRLGGIGAASAGKAVLLPVRFRIL